MTYKGIHLLTIGDLVFVFSHLTREAQRALLAAQPMLSGWVPQLQATFEALETLPAGEAPRGADHDTGTETGTRVGEETTLQRRDRLVEASVQALRQGLSAGRAQALASADAEAAARWLAADALVFSQGLGFLKRSLPEQVGETIRLLARAQDGRLAWVKARFNLHGEGWEAVVARIQHTNAALDEALRASAPTTTQAAISLAGLRRQALATLKGFLGVVEVALSTGGAAEAQLKAALLDPLSERIAFRLSKQAAEKAAAAEGDAQAPEGAPTP